MAEPAHEPRIVESGPIHLQVSLEEAIRLLIPHEALEAFVKEWVVKSLQAQASAQTEGVEQDG